MAPISIFYKRKFFAILLQACFSTTNGNQDKRDFRITGIAGHSIWLEREFYSRSVTIMVTGDPKRVEQTGDFAPSNSSDGQPQLPDEIAFFVKQAFRIIRP